MKNKRILIVTSEFPPQPGGIGNHAYNLAKHLQLEGLAIQVLTDQRSWDGLEEQDFDSSLNFKVHRIPNRRFRFWMYLQRMRGLFQLIKSCEVVMASGKFSLWMVALSSIFYKRNCIAILHGTEVNFKNKILKISVEFSLKRFSNIIAVSHFTKSLILHLKLKNVNVVLNGYDEHKWKNNIKADENLIGSPKLITVGNVSERKGQLQVIKHLPNLINEFPNIHYHCIGLPSKVEKFQPIINELKVGAHVTFHGRLDDSELQSKLMSADVFVMLSEETKTGDVEGFGIAILEANALGIPAIGSNEYGIQDAITNSKSGILIESKDSSKFLESLKIILNNKELFKKNSKLKVKKFKWSQVVKKYIKIINI